MNSYKFLVGMLVVWRLTRLLSKEDGPWDLLVRLRRVAGTGIARQLLDCFSCLSLWTAAPLAFVLTQGWKERLPPVAGTLGSSDSAGALCLESRIADAAIFQ